MAEKKIIKASQERIVQTAKRQVTVLSLQRLKSQPPKTCLKRTEVIPARKNESPFLKYNLELMDTEARLSDTCFLCKIYLQFRC